MKLLKKKIFIVDDEELILSSMERTLINLGFDDVSTYTNGIDCINALSEKPSVIFLDYNMDGLDGLKVLETIKKHNSDTKVIMVSSQNNIGVAVNAIKEGATDYLEKPFVSELVMESMYKIEGFKNKNSRTYCTEGAQNNELTAMKKVVISTQDTFELIAIDEIIYCESMDNYTWLVLNDNRRHLVSKTLKKFSQSLEGHGFLRIHQSYLVNANHITRLTKSDGGSVVLSNDTVLHISRRHKSTIVDFLNSKRLIS